MTTQERFEGIGHLVFPLAAFAILWYLGALIIGNAAVLPDPIHTVSLTIDSLTTPGPRNYTSLHHLRVTLVRVVIASTIGLALSVVGGTLMWSYDAVEDVLSDWLPFLMTFPTLVVILVTMILFRFSETSILTAVLVASVPFGIVNLWEGMKDIDTELLEMAYSYDASTLQIWRHVYIPHLMPFVFGSYRYILGMVWKIVALAEIFGFSVGMGAMFRFWYSQGEIDTLLAYFLLFIAVMLTVEYGLLKPLQTRIFRWRVAGES
jgi:NitT/TauT family transport system permease protein